jgi:small-conductance mechanosensitive channel
VARRRRLDAVNRIRKHNWSVGLVAAGFFVAALVVGSQYGGYTGTAAQPKIIGWSSAAVVLVSGVVASSRLSAALSHLTTERGAASAAGPIRVVSAATGYLIVAFAVLAVLDVQIGKILVGAGLAGVVLGIAAQQSLGNVFAGLVLLLARPFTVGDHIRVRSGALGGIFEAWVREMSLTYVTLVTDDGPLKIPNSAMLAAGIGQLPPAVVVGDAARPTVAGAVVASSPVGGAVAMVPALSNPPSPPAPPSPPTPPAGTPVPGP